MHFGHLGQTPIGSPNVLILQLAPSLEILGWVEGRRDIDMFDDLVKEMLS